MHVCFAFKYIKRHFVPGMAAGVSVYHQNIEGMTKAQFVQNVRHDILEALLPVTYDIVPSLHHVNGNDEYTEPALDESNELMEDFLRSQYRDHQERFRFCIPPPPQSAAFYLRERLSSDEPTPPPSSSSSSSSCYTCYTCNTIGTPERDLVCYFQCRFNNNNNNNTSATTTTRTRANTHDDDDDDVADDLLLPPSSLPHEAVVAAVCEQHLLCSPCHDGFLAAGILRCGICRSPHI